MTTSAEPTAVDRARTAPDDLGSTPIPIVTFRHEADKRPVAETLTWSTLMARLSRHQVRAAKDGRAWSPVAYRPGTTRLKANVDQVYAMVLDVDHVQLPYDRLAGLTWAAHTTHSHNPPNDPRWRVVIPLSHPVSGEEECWSVYWRRARERFGEAMDAACKDASRMYFWPACRVGGPHWVERGHGELLNPDSLPEVPPAALTRPAAARRNWAGNINPYTRAALDDEVGRVATAPPGAGGAGSGRNNQLNKSAFALGQLVAGGELPRGMVEYELLAAAERCGLINDDGVRATERTIQSGLDAAERSPRSTPEPTPHLPISTTKRTVDPITGEVFEEEDGFLHLPPLTRPRGRKLPPLQRPAGVSLPPLVRPESVSIEDLV